MYSSVSHVALRREATYLDVVHHVLSYMELKMLRGVNMFQVMKRAAGIVVEGKERSASRKRGGERAYKSQAKSRTCPTY